MTSTMSYDARAISEDDAAEFLGTLQGFLQNPASLMLPAQSVPRIPRAVITN